MGLLAGLLGLTSGNYLRHESRSVAFLEEVRVHIRIAVAELNMRIPALGRRARRPTTWLRRFSMRNFVSMNIPAFGLWRLRPTHRDHRARGREARLAHGSTRAGAFLPGRPPDRWRVSNTVV